LAGSGSDNEVTDSRDKSGDPEESEQVVPPDLVGSVIPNNISNWEGIVLFNVSNTLNVSSDVSPGTDPGDKQEPGEERNQNNLWGFNQEVRGSLSDGSCDSDVSPAAAQCNEIDTS
jgi:hypothetical protein